MEKKVQQKIPFPEHSIFQSCFQRNLIHWCFYQRVWEPQFQFLHSNLCWFESKTIKFFIISIYGKLFKCIYFLKCVLTLLDVNWMLNRFKHTSKTTPCFWFRYAFMPLIDDSDDEIEEFMVTSENLSEWHIFLLNDHCIYCNKEILYLYLWCKVRYTFFPVKYFLNCICRNLYYGRQSQKRSQ